jgi:hypothetical protein
VFKDTEKSVEVAIPFASCFVGIIIIAIFAAKTITLLSQNNYLIKT